MMRIYITTCLLFIAPSLLAQSKEQKFYTYLQKLITDSLRNNDSLIIDQFSEKNETYNWQTIIKRNGDSCFVIFMPPQYSQDTMLAEELIPINRFVIGTNDLIAAFQQEKDDLKNPNMKLKSTVALSVRYYDKREEFRLQRVQGLYYRLRYNRSLANKRNSE